MEKETVIQLTNTSVKVVCGSSNKTSIQLQSFKEYALMDGAMLNGVIMDEESVKEVLKQISQQGVESACLVIDSGQILRKNAVIPKMKPAEIMQVCKDELNTIEGEYEDLVYDYKIVQEKIDGQEGMEILCCAIEKSFLKTYLDVFEASNIKVTCIDISINALYKLTTIMPELNKKTYAITVIDGNDVASALFANNKMSFVNRSRLFSDRGSSAFVIELTNNISQLVQFNKTQNQDMNIDMIYFCGLDNYEDGMVFDTVKDTLDIKVDYLIDSTNIKTMINANTFALHDYAYVVGGLLRK